MESKQKHKAEAEEGRGKVSGKLTDDVMKTYLPMVHAIASLVAGKGLPPSIEYDDLVSDGVIGLMKAWDNFDPKRGVKFETYASYRIRGEMLDGLKMYNPVPYRVQVMVRNLAKRGKGQGDERESVAKEVLEMEQKTKKKKKKLTEDEFKSAVNKIRKIVSASALMYLLSLEGVQGTDVEKEGTPETEMEFGELRGRLRDAVSELPDLQKKVVHLFYDTGITQKEIASKLSLSKSKVNRLLGRAIEGLKDTLKGDEHGV